MEMRFNPFRPSQMESGKLEKQTWRDGPGLASHRLGPAKPPESRIMGSVRLQAPPEQDRSRETCGWRRT
jgi:hypothetical protein